MQPFFDSILIYVAIYPVIMSIIWVIGGISYEVRKRRRKKEMKEPEEEIKFTIVVPVYNEEDSIEETLRRNLKGVKAQYPNCYFWIIDDCSTDNTPNILDRFDGLEGIKITHLKENLGKAGVLNYALKHIKTNYFLCVDSDTYIYPNALGILNRVIYNEKDPKVSAYTGSLTVNQQDGSTAILKIQKLEYRSIIGTIKRTQDVFLKNLMTVSGALTCYKTQVLQELGGFSMDNATEDIEMTWRMSAAGYRSRFIDDFSAEIFSPSNGFELIKQRVRWNLGGMQTFKKYRHLFFKKNFHAVRMFQLDRILSVFWLYAFIITTAMVSSQLILGFPGKFDVTEVIFPTTMLLGSSLILQIVSYFIDKNEKEYLDEFLVLILYYPLAYWLVQPAGYMTSLWKYYFVKKDHGKWRRSGKYNVRLRSLVSALLDISIYFLLISLWKIVLEALVILFPHSMITVYYFVLIFWMGLALIFSKYFISVKRSTLAENLLGLRSQRKRNSIQSLFAPISLLILANTVLNSYVTVELLSLNDFSTAVQYVQYHIAHGGIVNENLYWFYLLVFVDRFFGISKKWIKNPLVKV